MEFKHNSTELDFTRFLRAASISLLALGIVSLSLAASTGTAQAAAITVNTNITDINADGLCSLTEAIINANDDAATHSDCPAGSGADTIELANITYSSSLPFGTSSALPSIDSDITIKGNGAIIQNGLPFPIPLSAISISPVGTLTLEEVTITGYTSAGLVNNGTANVVSSLIAGNTTSIFTSGGPSSQVGGGIRNLGEMTLSDTTVTENSFIVIGDPTLPFSFSGGGIFNRGTLTANNSTISFNTANDLGGGIQNVAGTVVLNNSTLHGNQASVGGGIANDAGTTTLNRSLIAANIANIFTNELYGVGITANNYNLLGDSSQTNSSAFGFVTPGATDITATSDGTTPTAINSILNTTLALNGGSTINHSLPTGSPAIDAAPTANCSGNAQNRIARNTNGSGSVTSLECDIGSFEAEDATAIELASFSTMLVDSTTLIVWTTAAEIDNAGFNLYASDSVEGRGSKLNEGLIAAQGSAIKATDYAFSDESNAAYYMLEDIDTSGVATLHGPITVGGGAEDAANNSFSLFLPLLQQ